MRKRGQGSRTRAVAIIALVSLLAFAGLAWMAEWSLTDESDVPPLAVTRNGVTLAELSMDELRDLPARKLSQFGKVEEGPSVLDVLAEAGVTDFTRVTVVGPGVRDDGSLVLTADAVTDDIILDFANRGTVKIAGPNIEWADRVRDVTELRVD